MNNEAPELFEGLTPEAIDGLMALGSNITVPRGGELFRLGDPADNLFVIERGRLRLTLPMQVGGRDEDVLVEERSPGQVVGWSALIPPYRFTLTAMAPLDTRVIVLPRDQVRAYFAEHPAVGYAVSLNLAQVIGQRLQLFQTMWLREMQRTVELHCA